MSHKIPPSQREFIESLLQTLEPMIPKVTNRPVATLDEIVEPEPMQTVMVGMNEFGYLGLDESRQWLATTGLGPCIGIHVYNPQRKSQLLMHSSGNFMLQSQELIRHGRIKGLLDQGFPERTRDTITIFASAYAKEQDVEKVVQGLHQMKCDDIRVVTAPHLEPINVAFGQDGKGYWIRPETIRPMELNELDFLRMTSKALNPDEVTCVNNGERFDTKGFQYKFARYSVEQDPLIKFMDGLGIDTYKKIKYIK